MKKHYLKVRLLINFIALIAIILMFGSTTYAKMMLQKRYVFILGLTWESDVGVNNIIDLINRANRVGYNGIVLDDGLYNTPYCYDQRSRYTTPQYYANLKRIRDYCDYLKMACFPGGLASEQPTIGDIHFSEAKPTTANVIVGSNGTVGSGALWEPIVTPSRPVVVKSQNGSITYKEGQDYKITINSNSGWTGHPSMRKTQGQMSIPSSSTIKQGDILTVSWHRMVANGWKVGNDTTNWWHFYPPADYCEPAIWDSVDSRVKYFASKLFPNPPAYFMLFDEWDPGFWDPNCPKTAGYPTAGSYIGGVVNKTAKHIRKYCPQAEVYVWDDMMDLYDFNETPDPKVPTWGWNGSIYGAWDSIPASGPNNIVIMNWASKKRTKLFWAGKDPAYPQVKEHKQIITNTDDPAYHLACMDTLEKLGASDSAVIGYMYVTWYNDYSKIEANAASFKAAGRWGTGPAFANFHPPANLPGMVPPTKVNTVPLDYKLLSHINPPSSMSTIQYDIPENTRVQINLINPMGQTVKNFIGPRADARQSHNQLECG